MRTYSSRENNQNKQPERSLVPPSVCTKQRRGAAGPDEQARGRLQGRQARAREPQPRARRPPKRSARRGVWSAGSQRDAASDRESQTNETMQVRNAMRQATESSERTRRRRLTARVRDAGLPQDLPFLRERGCETANQAVVCVPSYVCPGGGSVLAPSARGDLS